MIETSLLLMALAILLDAVIGDPSWLYRKVAHPVVLIGRLIHTLEQYLNNDHYSFSKRKRRGCFAVAFLICAVGGFTIGVHGILEQIPYGLFVEALLASTLIAQRSLYGHVRDVVVALEKHGLAGGRIAVSRIVGRDVNLLDENGVRRGAIESLAENLSDGVVAPIVWGCLLGLPGIAIYKAINTADSMIGHKTDRYRAFGWAAARLDDWVNWIPARLTGLFLCVASLSKCGTAFRVMWRDASRHRSPNAGWPEAAMAGALSIRLSGPRRYAEGFSDEPWLNQDGQDPSNADVWRGLRLMMLVCGGVLGVIVILTVAV